MSSLTKAAAVGAAVVAAGAGAAAPAPAAPDTRDLRIPQTSVLHLPPVDIALAANGRDLVVDGVMLPFGDTPQAERLREMLRQQPGQRLTHQGRIVLVGGGGNSWRDWRTIPNGSSKPGSAGVDGGPPVDNPNPSLADQVASNPVAPKMPNEHKQPQAGPIYPHAIDAQ